MNRCIYLICFIAVLLSFQITAYADFPSTYFDTVDETTSATLRSSLNDIITAGQVVVPFDNFGSTESFEALGRTDADDVNPAMVRLLYSNDRRYSYNEVNDKLANTDETTGGWNREHAWPQSFFNMLDPMVSDLHSLFPADADINSRRNNSGYTNVTGASIDSYGNEWDGDEFQPIDAHKGDVARAIMYMDVRFAGESGEPDLSIIEDYTALGTGNLTMATLSVLQAWHNADPPSPFEARRNHRVYDEQFNANPFIDNPNWANTIYGFALPSVTDADTITVSGGTFTNSEIQQGEQRHQFLLVSLTLGANEYDFDSLTVSEIGTATDADFLSISLFHDADGSGHLTPGDVLLDSQPVSGGSATLTSIAPLRLAPGTEDLIVAATMSPTATLGATVQLRVDANSVTHNDRGGVDTDPTFVNITSSARSVVESLPTGLVVAMVSTGNATSSNHEYIVIANHAGASVDLTGYELRKRSGTGSSMSITDLVGTIPAFGYFIIATDDYVGPIEGGITPDQVVATLVGGMSGTSGNVLALYTPNAEFIDSVSWGGGPTENGGMLEGTAFATTLSTGQDDTQVFARKQPGGGGSNFQDTQDNANDMEILMTKIPFSGTTPVTISGYGID